MAGSRVTLSLQTASDTPVGHSLVPTSLDAAQGLCLCTGGRGRESPWLLGPGAVRSPVGSPFTPYAVDTGVRLAALTTWVERGGGRGGHLDMLPG